MSENTKNQIIGFAIENMKNCGINRFLTHQVHEYIKSFIEEFMRPGYNPSISDADIEEFLQGYSEVYRGGVGGIFWIFGIEPPAPQSREIKPY